MFTSRSNRNFRAILFYKKDENKVDRDNHMFGMKLNTSFTLEVERKGGLVFKEIHMHKLEKSVIARCYKTILM